MTRTWRNLFHKKERDLDLDREIDSYLENLIVEKRRMGLSEPEATRAARLELGGAEQVKEAVRDVRAGAFIEEWSSDLRYAARGLRRSPGFSIVMILSLALGVGVNSVAFSNVQWLVLHPFPFAQLDRLMTVWETSDKTRSREDVAPANFIEWQQRNRSFENLAAYRGENVTMTRAGDPERIQAQSVTDHFFQVLGVDAQAGRTFLKEEYEAGRENEVVVSHRFWKNRLGSPANILGQTLVLGPKEYLVTGVMPEHFEYPNETDVWTPLAMTANEKTERSARSLQVIGRLKADVSPERALADLRTVASFLEARYPLSNKARTVRLVPILDTANGNGVGTRFIVVLFAGALFVMLLACANCANLLLARATARQKEIGIRAALGANGGRIARQVLSEVFLLSLASAAAGVVLATWNLGQIKAGIPPQALRYVPGMQRMHMDLTTVAYSVALSVLAGLLCAVPTLLQLLGPGKLGGLLETLKEAGRGSGRNSSRARLRSLIVIGESAVALLLLIGAGLMVSAFKHMLKFDRGFDPHGLLTMQTSLPESRYATAAQQRLFITRATAALQNTPGVTVAAIQTFLQLGSLRLENGPVPLPGEPEAAFLAATPGYLDTMKIHLLEGRFLSSGDGADASPVVVISQSLARHYWAGRSPIGQRFRIGKDPRWFLVTGVCGDLKDWFTGQTQLTAYGSLQQSPRLALTLFLRTAGDPLRLISDARRQVSNIDPNQPVFEVDSMEHLLEVETSGVHAAANMMTTYAGIALLLAITGIYSLSAYLIARRTHEIGLRIALGAKRGQIIWLSMIKSARLSGVGVAIGLAAAIGLSRLMSSVLFDVISLDWRIFGAFATLLIAAALLAAYIPANRASHLDPMVALRHE